MGEFKDIVCSAINKRLDIRFDYRDANEDTFNERIVSPTKIGLLMNNTLQFEGYLISGYSQKGTLPPWRLYKLHKDSIMKLELTDVGFDSVGPEYRYPDKRFKLVFTHI